MIISYLGVYILILLHMWAWKDYFQKNSYKLIISVNSKLKTEVKVAIRQVQICLGSTWSMKLTSDIQQDSFKENQTQ